MQDPTKPLVVSDTNNSKRSATPASWKPGQSGNPNGRPKRDWTWRDLLEEAAEEFVDVKVGEGKSSRFTFKKLIARKLFSEASKGNIGAIRELINRMDGMPQQKIDMKHEGGVSLLMDSKFEK